MERLDRLARDLMIHETIIRDLKKKKVEVVSVSEADLLQDDPSQGEVCGRSATRSARRVPVAITAGSHGYRESAQAAAAYLINATRPKCAIA